MDCYQRDVEAFRIALDLPCGDLQAPRIVSPVLSAELIREESQETIDGLINNDLTAAADGLIDISYVGYGAAVTFGIDLKDTEPGHRLPEKIPCLVNQDQHADSIAWAARRAIEQIESGQLTSIEVYLRNLIRRCRDIAQHCGIPFDKVWREIHASNMTKKGGPIRADGKRQKPLGWTPPNVEKILADHAHQMSWLGRGSYRAIRDRGRTF